MVIYNSIPRYLYCWRVRRLFGLGSAQNSEALTGCSKVGPRQSYEHKSSLLLLAVFLHGGLEIEISHDKTKDIKSKEKNNIGT